MIYRNPNTARFELLDEDQKREAKLLRLCEDLRDKIYSPLDISVDWRFNEADLLADDALVADWATWPALTDRTVWGKSQGHTWLAAEVSVPETARDSVLVARLSSQWQERPGSTDPQCLAYLDGKIAQALDGNHTELVIEDKAVPGQSHVIMVNAFTFFDRPLTGFRTELLLRDLRIEQLYFDLVTPLEVALRLPQNDGRRHAILEQVERSLRALDRRDGQEAALLASLSAAEAEAARIYAIVDTEKQPTVTAVGHTHLDVGWLWRVLHTRDKTGRSFATVLSLMAEYPGFVFMYNQAVLFHFLKSDYPEIWQAVKARVAEGQFEIEGAMWVEPDANIVSGESMVRQILRGSRFHQEEFGVTPRSIWLPDTFGYSANMPQIARAAGIDYFITSKLSWNDTDRHPHDTFFWRGIDGTRLKAQLLTAQRFESEGIFTTYNSDLSVSEVMGAWRRYEPKSAHSDILVCYGYGDGGGGPTRAMIETGKRLERGIPGAPKVRLEGLGPFLDRLGTAMGDRPDRFPTWNGELYLQYHRGTLTSVAKNKVNNRKSERLMRELELAMSLASLADAAAYSGELMRELWDIVLINQFHDILPGTSIKEVYEDSDRDYDMLFDAVEGETGALPSALAALSPDTARAIVFNSTGQLRDGELAVVLPGQPVPAEAQALADPEDLPRHALPLARGPALGWAVAVPDTWHAPDELSVSTTHLENSRLRLCFDDAGEITSVFDKTAQRELLPKGARANRLVAYEDKPKNWDAWDIDAYFEEQSWPLSEGPCTVEVVETGPYRAAIRVTRCYARSRVVQIISLQQGARQVEFDTWVDWRERQTVLKVLFPLDLNSSEVRSEIQFGHVTRATHRNTSWDRARHEASMQRWLDMSEADFGAALLNDCKYGYDAHEQTLRLTLLKSPVYPDKDADRGEHRMRYALYLHDGIADLAEVPRAAERFNMPLRLTAAPIDISRDALGVPGFSFAECDAANVTLETVKRSEDGSGLILRLHEHANRRAEARIKFGVPLDRVRNVTLLEQQAGPDLNLQDNTVHLALRPFEIVTLLVEPSG